MRTLMILTLLFSAVSLAQTPQSSLEFLKNDLNQAINLHFNPIKEDKEIKIINYKQWLKQYLALEIHPHVKIGIDRLKAVPLSAAQIDILETPPALQIKSSSLISRGYGINIKIDL